MNYDTKTKYDRIGKYLIIRAIKKLCIGIIIAGIGTVSLLHVTTLLINKSIAELQYKDTVQQIKYLNTRHK